jgi:hypothetical protein
MDEIGPAALGGRVAGVGLDDGRVSYLSPDALRSLDLMVEEGPLLAASPKTGKRKPARPKPASPKPGSPKPGSPKPGSPKPGSPKPGSPKPPGSPKRGSRKP